MMKKQGVITGLGDRLGCYLIYALIGELKNTDIFTTWVYDSDRGKEYPDNIFDYISFPERLKFISDEEYNNLNIPELNYRWVYHAFDYIPETVYKSLKKDRIISCNFDVMLNAYRKVSKELFYKKELPIEYKERPGIIHLRRDDKGSNVDHNDRIINLVNKYSSTIKKWIITSDSDIPLLLLNNIPNLLYPKWSFDKKIKAIEEFFMYSHSSLIIQSVNFQKEIESMWSGWTGFSYIGFQIGMANYPDNQPILISCNNDNENTRFTYAKKYAERELINIYMYNNIYQ